jgi:hypothetical protein
MHMVLLGSINLVCNVGEILSIYLYPKRLKYWSLDYTYGSRWCLRIFMFCPIHTLAKIAWSDYRLHDIEDLDVIVSVSRKLSIRHWQGIRHPRPEVWKSFHISQPEWVWEISKIMTVFIEELPYLLRGEPCHLSFCLYGPAIGVRLWSSVWYTS